MDVPQAGSWHYCTDIESLTIDKIVEIETDDKKLCLLRKADKVYSFAATCPHSGAKLCEGWLDVQERIVCPLHKYRFDPANGRNTSGEGYKLKTFPVELREDAIFVWF